MNGRQTPAQVAKVYQVRLPVLEMWKDRFLECGAELFKREFPDQGPPNVKGERVRTRAFDAASSPPDNQRGTAEQWIREGKNAAKWTRLSCRSMTANAVRLQLHALAYNLANFFRTLVLPDEVERWSLTTLRERVVKIGAKVIAHARYTVFQMAEVAVPRNLFGRILAMINDLRPRPVARC